MHTENCISVILDIAYCSNITSELILLSFYES
jgi:hypothetical protein